MKDVGLLVFGNNKIIRSLGTLRRGRDIYASNSNIEDLGELESVRDLYLANTPVKALKPSLRVTGHLDLYRTPIKTLPDDLIVKAGITLPDGTSTTSITEARKWFTIRYPVTNGVKWAARKIHRPAPALNC